MALTKLQRRNRIKNRIRKKVFGTSERPRMSIFRSNKQIAVQIINDDKCATLIATSSLNKEISKDAKVTKVQMASIVGELIAKKALEIGVKSIVFDRGGYLYHGRVKALADAARNKGLNF